MILHTIALLHLKLILVCNMISPLKKRIQENLEEKAAQYEADIKSGKKKPIVPVEDYINEEGIRIRVYKSPSSNG